MWFIIILTLCSFTFIKYVLPLFSNKKKDFQRNFTLPPGPRKIPFIGNVTVLLQSFFLDFETILRGLKSKHGPLITLWIGSAPTIFIADHSLAHHALVQRGAIFSSRPPITPTGMVYDKQRRLISTGVYGPTWKLLRRNLTSENLNPSRVMSYSPLRRRVFGNLARSFCVRPEDVDVAEHIEHAIFSLLCFTCLGDNLDEEKMKEIMTVVDRFKNYKWMNLLNSWPLTTKIVFPRLWREFRQIQRDQQDVLIPLIKARIEQKHRQQGEEKKDEEEERVTYLDTILDLELPDEKRKLNFVELVNLCVEFLIASVDTTSTLLVWIMANLVKNPMIQERLYKEIVSVMGPPPPPGEYKLFVNEDDVQRMPYLKAVVLEGLRRHPPTHLTMPHLVAEDMELDGYLIPKDATVIFTLVDMGWDPEVWADPMEFRPERFLEDSEEVNVKENKEIKMMPFSAGRRVCPGSTLALLLLHFFIPNLIWYFHWSPVEGHDVDLTEKPGFIVPMNNPPRARISFRNHSTTT